MVDVLCGFTDVIIYTTRGLLEGSDCFIVLASTGNLISVHTMRCFQRLAAGPTFDEILTLSLRRRPNL